MMKFWQVFNFLKRQDEQEDLSELSDKELEEIDRIIEEQMAKSLEEQEILQEFPSPEIAPDYDEPDLDLWESLQIAAFERNQRSH